VNAALAADYEIAQLDLELILVQITELYRLDMAQRQELAACSPIAWDASQYGAEL
jgi:hypothetical protein